MHDSLLSVDEVAALFRVSKRTVYRWNSTGAGPMRVRVGSQIFFREEDVRDFIRASRVEL